MAIQIKRLCRIFLSYSRWLQKQKVKTFLLSTFIPSLIISFPSLSFFPFTTQNTAYHLCNRSLLEGTSATTVRNLHQITAALVSLACRVEGHPRTIQEISAGSGLDPSVINNMQSTLARQLHVETGIIRPGKLHQRQNQSWNHYHITNKDPLPTIFHTRHPDPNIIPYYLSRTTYTIRANIAAYCRASLCGFDFVSTKSPSIFLVLFLLILVLLLFLVNNPYYPWYRIETCISSFDRY